MRLAAVSGRWWRLRAERGWDQVRDRDRVRAGVPALCPGMAEPQPEQGRQSPGDEKAAAPAPKKRRVSRGERYVPPPRRLSTGVSFGAEHFAETSYYFEGGLRKVRPYYFDFRTYCKGRWVGRSLLHVFTTEFRAQPLAYYRAAARAGRLRLNEEPVRDLDVILKNNDFLRNTVHRHEPPVTAQPLRILVENEEVVVVDKPSSLPVHPCGRFRHNSVIFILGKEHHLEELHTIHRLDRMTSGVLMFAKTLEVSKRMDEQVRGRQLEKEYVCRVVGEFPEHEVVCEEPILVVSYKVGVCRVDPKGKFSRTIFQRLSYNGQSSVVRCLPRTGRTHQIRVHLQFLGHPIVNDPIYNTQAWGPDRGRAGRIGKTDEELLKALVEEHRAKQSLDILGISEQDWETGTENEDCGGSKDCTESGKDEPIRESSCPAQDPEGGTRDSERGTRDPEGGTRDSERGTRDPEGGTKDSERGTRDPEGGTKDPERNGVAACPLDSGSNLERLKKNEELCSGGNCEGETGGKGSEEKDPLCPECSISRRDPSPQELVMYLHALRYKGAEFEYCSQMPEWAREDWEG